MRSDYYTESAMAGIMNNLISSCVSNFIELKPKQFEALRLIKTYFRGHHQEDILVNLPVGYGKSLLYQVIPALIRRIDFMSTGDEVVLVVSPLNIIQDDQLRSMAERNITCCKIKMEGMMVYIKNPDLKLFNHIYIHFKKVTRSCVEGCKSSWWGPACTESYPGECQEECDLHSVACITDTTVTFRTSSQVEQASTSTQKTSSDCDRCTTNRPSQHIANTSQGLDLTVILSVIVTLVVLAIFAGMILCIFRNGCPQRQMNKQDNEEVPLEEFPNVYERLNDDSLTASASTNESYDRLQLGDSVTASDEQTTSGCPSPMNQKPETDCNLGTERPKTPVSTPDPLPMSSYRTDSEQDMWRESPATLCLDPEQQFIPKASRIKQTSDSFKPENGDHNKAVFDPTNKYAIERSSQLSLTKLAPSEGEKEINNPNISPKTPRHLTTTTGSKQSLEKASSAEYDDQDKSSTKNQQDTSNYPHPTSEARKTLNKVTLEKNDDDKEIIGTKDPPDKFKFSHTNQTSETRKNRELEKVHQSNALNDSEHRNVTSDVNGIPVKVTTANERIETVNAEKSVYASEEFCSNVTSEIEEVSDHHATENENEENQCSSTKSQTHPSTILAYTRVPSEIKQTSVELAACTFDGKNEVNPENQVRLSRQPDATTSQIKQNEDDHVSLKVNGDKENNTSLSIPL